MPRFYFHVRRGAILEVDNEGVEFPTLEEARQEAIRAAREIIADQLIKGDVEAEQSFEITSEAGVLLHQVPFRFEIGSD
jgi:hypothetical protein